MARPAILAFEPDEADRARLVRELVGRYGDDYDVDWGCVVTRPTADGRRFSTTMFGVFAVGDVANVRAA